jgi:hypothetical protein
MHIEILVFKYEFLPKKLQEKHKCHISPPHAVLPKQAVYI